MKIFFVKYYLEIVFITLFIISIIILLATSCNSNYERYKKNTDTTDVLKYKIINIK